MIINNKLKKLLKTTGYILLSAGFATGVFAATTPVAATAAPVTASATPPVLTNFSQNIQLTTPIQQLAVSKTVNLTANLTNTGSETWNTFINITKTPNATNLVYFSAQWVDGNGHVVSTAVFPLGKNLLAKQSITHAFPITAPSNPGAYTLRLSMMQQGVAWFYEKGGNPLNVPVKITAS